ncbi:MAG: tRNA (5-methylaminomethyl-2-thiouridine)(34)-methyltransferase MnmD [Bacteroidota bacterium]
MIKIITTSDGSHSLLNEELDETYHSKHGAVQESMHVFIKNGLEYYPKDDVNIFEVGFGTGLNALLTALSNKRVNYTAIEAFPISEEIVNLLNYSPQDLLKQLHINPKFEITNFKLNKIHTTLQSITLDPIYDIIFFDAFAPSKQPEMWEFPMIEKVCNALVPGGLFVTYCAKGQLKRDLKTLGMQVETLVGPPGKKEMVRATKSYSAELHRGSTEFHREMH